MTRIAQTDTGRHRYPADALTFARTRQLEVPALCGEWSTPRPTTVVLAPECLWCAFLDTSG